jgi:hypothetical protein
LASINHYAIIARHLELHQHVRISRLNLELNIAPNRLIHSWHRVVHSVGALGLRECDLVGADYLPVATLLASD